MSKWTHEDIVKVASEMYEDGTSNSERYSVRSWKARGWPPIDNLSIHRVLSYYLKFMRSMDEYAGTELPEYKRESLVKKSVKDIKKT